MSIFSLHEAAQRQAEVASLRLSELRNAYHQKCVRQLIQEQVATNRDNAGRVRSTSRATYGILDSEANSVEASMKRKEYEHVQARDKTADAAT